MKKMLVLALILLAPVAVWATVHGEYYEIRLTGLEVCQGQRQRITRVLALHIPKAEGEIWVGEDQSFSEGWRLYGPRWRERGRYRFSSAGSALQGWISLSNRPSFAVGNYIYTRDGCYEKGTWRITNTFLAPE